MMTPLTLLLALLLAPSHIQGSNQEKGLRAALADAQRKWEEGRPSAYEFTVDIRCFCGGLVRTAPRFRVIDGEPEAITELSAESQKLYSYFNTVEKLFGAIDRSLSRGQYKSTVKYDQQLGFPLSADLDPERLVKDEELYVRVSGFRVIERPSPHVSIN